MSVWLCIPSARPVAEVNARMDKWRDMGYKIALWRDLPEDDVIADQVLVGRYPGYAVALNTLADVLRRDLRCDWIVAAGDDTDPDPAKRADEIARECSEYFAARRNHQHTVSMSISEFEKSRTFGVMQPTGDPWADHQGRIIERIAGSPWLGREWCRRAYAGKGPLWPEYTHCFADEELQLVAQRYGVFWQRPDLTQHHDNWARARGNPADRPAFLDEANSPEHWRKYQALFNKRKAAGFPGSELIA